MLNEFEWPSLEVCSVGVGLLFFSSIGFIVVLCLLKIWRQVLEPAHSSKVTRLSHWILEIHPKKYRKVLKNRFFPLLFPLWNIISPMQSLHRQQRSWRLSHFFQTQSKFVVYSPNFKISTPRRNYHHWSMPVKKIDTGAEIARYESYAVRKYVTIFGFFAIFFPYINNLSSCFYR